MPHDPEFVAETRAWLQKAKQDLAYAEVLRHSDSSLLEGAVFHYQQAAEKSLKAFLIWHRRTFGKTHDIGQLGRSVAKISGDLRDLLQEASVLTDYSWMYRYPGETTQLAASEAENAARLAKRVYEAVLRRLPEEAHP